MGFLSKLSQRRLPYNILIFPVIASFMLLSFPWMISLPPSGDEFVYGYVGGELVGKQLYPELTDQPPEIRARYYPNSEHPPLSKIFIGLSIYIFDNPRIISWFFGAASIYVMYRFISEAHTKLAGLVSSVLLSFSPIFIAHAFVALIDIYFLFFILLSFWLLTRESIRGSTLAFSAAMITKLSILFMLPAIAYYKAVDKKSMLKLVGMHLAIGFAVFTVGTSLYNNFVDPRLNNPISYWHYMFSFHKESSFITMEGTPLIPDPWTTTSWMFPYLLPGHHLFNAIIYYDLFGMLAVPVLIYSVIRLRRIRVANTLVILFVTLFAIFSYIGFFRPVGVSWFLPNTMVVAALLGISISDTLLRKYILE